MALSLAAILPIIYGLKELAKDDAGPLPLLAVVAGLVVGVFFVRRQRALASPLIDLRLFRNRPLATALVAMLFSMLIAGGTYLFVTQYLQLVVGLSPLRAGLWLLPAALALIVTSMLSPVLAGKIAPARVVAAGLAVSAVGHLMLALLDSQGGLTQLVVGFLLVYAGGGPLIALGTDIVVGSAPPEQAGSASAVSETSTELGMALGVAILGSVGAIVYRSQFTAPEGSAAGDTLAAAVAAAQQLPGDAGAALLAAARDAFTGGLNLVGAISTVITVLLAVAVLTMVRDRPAGDAEAGADDAVPAQAAS
ncbi:MFS transporter [Micromonospora sp. DH15]|nr:MFS transporter [Micromonospora sp. DH15]